MDLEHQSSVNTRAVKLIRNHRQHGDSYQVEFHGLTLLMLPEVFCPTYGEGSQLLADCLQVQPGEKVLEIGTGSGALAILAARQGGKVIATDISPVAVSCARENIKINHCQDKVTIYEGDLFEPISNNEKFSLIIFNPPFMEGKPKSLLDVGIYDENYRTLSRFFADFPNYLQEGGRVLIAFSTAGDMNYFQKLTNKSKESGFSERLIARRVINSLEFVVYAFEKT